MWGCTPASVQQSSAIKHRRYHQGSPSWGQRRGAHPRNYHQASWFLEQMRMLVPWEGHAEGWKQCQAPLITSCLNIAGTVALRRYATQTQHTCIKDYYSPEKAFCRQRFLYACGLVPKFQLKLNVLFLLLHKYADYHFSQCNSSPPPKKKAASTAILCCHRSFCWDGH